MKKYPKDLSRTLTMVLLFSLLLHTYTNSPYFDFVRMYDVIKTTTLTRHRVLLTDI